jgi:hypothetical protein
LIYFGDFLNNPLLLACNSAEHENPVLSIFKFQGLYRTQTEQGFFWRQYFSQKNNMRRRSTQGDP